MYGKRIQEFADLGVPMQMLALNPTDISLSNNEVCKKLSQKAVLQNQNMYGA